MPRSSGSFKSRKPRPPGALAKAQFLAESGTSLHQAAAQAKLPVSTVKTRARLDRWAVPATVRRSAESLAQFQIPNVGVPCWEMGGNLGQATRQTLQAARFPIFPCEDSLIDKLLKGTITQQDLYKRLKPQIDAATHAQQHLHVDATVAPPATPVRPPISPDENPIPLFEGEPTRLTITFTPPPNSPMIENPGEPVDEKPQRFWSNGKPRNGNAGPRLTGRESTPPKAEIEPWQVEREPVKQALAAELHRVATFFPVCKTISDVKTALQIHRDLHGKLEQASGPNSVIINLGMLRDCSREKLARGKIAGS